MTTVIKPRILTGDTPTGRLHLGHWVGSLENRVLLQDDYDCYFIIANVQGFTTRMDRPAEVQQNVLDVAMDYLAAGIDPTRSTIFIQSEIPAIAELTLFFSMLIPFPRLMRNPTIKDEIRDKGLGDNYPAGFLFYPVHQVADILAFRAEIVPVGEDQIPHLELAREVARRFNQLYCGVDPHTKDKDNIAKGGLFPVIEAKLGRTRRLVGVGSPSAEGNLLKMSKSLDNAIFLSDDSDTIAKKVRSMYTDPNRLRPTDKGTIENNPLWIFHETFNPDTAWVQEAEERYRQGAIGDVECKKRLIEVLVHIIEPIRQRRLQYENDKAQVMAILRGGTERAREVTGETLQLAKKAMKQWYF
ncbi:MAG: tryptophan--tRNA ligase [Gammaproteobacteria bacterium RIFCSPHIGHO2_12_FULL_45_9]|nr:MAG: tryptophan--tRNA ligase [Gammaproteobacteria bacterium RIFCSPHIGHO2_12_FULL_45_9]